jgi:hypothetical protein
VVLETAEKLQQLALAGHWTMGEEEEALMDH